MATVLPRDFHLRGTAGTGAKKPPLAFPKHPLGIPQAPRDRPHGGRRPNSAVASVRTSAVFVKRNFVAVWRRHGWMVVETDSKLSHHLEGRPAPRQKKTSASIGVAQGGHEPVDAGPKLSRGSRLWAALPDRDRPRVGSRERSEASFRASPMSQVEKKTR